MPKITITVELSTIPELDAFNRGMQSVFGQGLHEVAAMPAPTKAPAPAATASPTAAPTAAPTPAPTAAPTAAPATAAPAAGTGAIVLNLDPATPYEKTGLGALVAKAVQTKGRQPVIDVLAKFGAAKAGDVKPTDRAAFADQLQALTA